MRTMFGKIIYYHLTLDNNSFYRLLYIHITKHHKKVLICAITKKIMALLESNRVVKKTVFNASSVGQ